MTGGPAPSVTWSAGRGGPGKGGRRLKSGGGGGCWGRCSRVRQDCPQEKGKKPRVQMLRELLQREGQYGGDA